MDRDDILERLMHLLPPYLQQPRVNPILGQWLLAGKSFRMSDLGLVMGKDEIRTATMDVVRRTKVSDRHRSVLNVPAGPTLAPRTIPRDFTRLLTLPEHKIGRVPLQRVRINPMNNQVFDPLSRQLAITRELCDVKGNAPAINSITEPFLEKSLNLAADLGQMLASRRLQADP